MIKSQKASQDNIDQRLPYLNGQRENNLPYGFGQNVSRPRAVYRKADLAIIRQGGGLLLYAHVCATF